MPMPLESLMIRSKKAWGQKGNWESLYDDAYSLALPNRNTFYTNTPGEDKKQTVYDSTLQKSTIRLASTLQSTITPPFSRWAEMTPGPMVGQDREMLSNKMKAINDAVFAALSISNFDIAVGEFYLDITVGTSSMLVLAQNESEGDAPFKFETVPTSEIALDSSGVFRKYKKPAREIKVLWPDAKKIPELEKIIMEDGEKKISIQEITYKEGKKYYYSVFIEKVEDSKEPFMLVERTYRTNPWIIAKWMKLAGENYGRGPVLDALPDAKTLNAAKKMELQNASLKIAAPVMVKSNGMLNPNAIQIKPGAKIPVMSTGGTMGADIAILDMGGDIKFSQIVQEDLRQSIKDALFDRSIPDQGAVRSATEWITRQQELQEAIGAPFGRLYQEFIIPLYNRMLDILNQAGIIEPVTVNGGVVDVQITGPLAQAQNLKDVETVTNWAQTSIALVGPEVFNIKVKTEEIPAHLSKLMGIPVNLLRSAQESKALADKAMNAVQQQQGGEPVGEPNGQGGVG